MDQPETDRKVVDDVDLNITTSSHVMLIRQSHMMSKN